MIDQNGHFRFDGLSSVEWVEEPDLSNTEREMLRAYAKEGMPLWKVMQFFALQIQALTYQIANLPLVSEENVAAARDLQQRMMTLIAQHRLWEGLLSPVPAKPEENKDGQ